jgi:hypothetical protein
MGKTPREQMLIMFFPAFIVVAVYMLGYNRDAELTTARNALAAARPTAVSLDDVEFERLKMDDLEAKKEVVQKEKAVLDARWAALGSVRQSEPAARAFALQKLSKMLWDRGLYPFEESAAPDGSADLPPSFQEVLTKLAGDKPTTGGQRLWKIRFYGRYADVLETLESLRDSGSSVIPVSLSMSESRAETSWRSWTLLLWI